MANPESADFFDLAQTCVCKPCIEKMLGIVKKIDGVDSSYIDAKTKKLIISGTVDPQKVIKKLLDKLDKTVKLVPKGNNHNGGVVEGGKLIHRKTVLKKKTIITYSEEVTEEVEVKFNVKNKDHEDHHCGGHDTGSSSGCWGPNGR